MVKEETVVDVCAGGFGIWMVPPVSTMSIPLYFCFNFLYRLRETLQWRCGRGGGSKAPSFVCFPFDFPYR